MKAAGRLGEAISVLQRTLEIDPGSVAALNNLGLCLRDLNALPEALEVFQKALRLEPEDSVLLANAASVLQLLLRDAEAARFYRASLTLAPGTRPALLGLAGLATEAGAYAEAQERYDELLSATIQHGATKIVLSTHRRWRPTAIVARECLYLGSRAGFCSQH